MTATVAPTTERRAGVVGQSLSMVLSTAINSGFGMVFWVVAARTYTSHDVGVASAAVSGISLILGVGQLGLPLALPRLLPSVRDHARDLVTTTYALGIVVSIGAAAVFVLVGRHIDGVDTLFRSTPFALWFIASAPCCVIFAVQDFVLCGLHRASWTPAENLAYSVGRLVLLGALVSMGASGLYLAWTLPAAGAAAAITWLLFRRVLDRAERDGGIEPLDRRHTAKLISSDYLGSLTQTAAIRLLPLLIVASLGEASSAYFYVAWTVVFAADTVLANVITAVTVDGATSRDRMARNVGAVLRRGGALVALGVVVLIAAAGPVLGTFSREYRAGTFCLQLLALSLVPRFALLVTAAAARHERQPSRIVTLQVVPAVLTIVGAALCVGPGGIAGVAAAYLLAQVLTLVACVGWLRPWVVTA